MQNEILNQGIEPQAAVIHHMMYLYNKKIRKGYCEVKHTGRNGGIARV
jgi:hypothetical protein